MALVQVLLTLRTRCSSGSVRGPRMASKMCGMEEKEAKGSGMALKLTVELSARWC